MPPSPVCLSEPDLSAGEGREEGTGSRRQGPSEDRQHAAGDGVVQRAEGVGRQQGLNLGPEQVLRVLLQMAATADGQSDDEAVLSMASSSVSNCALKGLADPTPMVPPSVRENWLRPSPRQVQVGETVLHDQDRPSATNPIPPPRTRIPKASGEGRRVEKDRVRVQPAVRKTAPEIERSGCRCGPRSASRSEPIDQPRLRASTAVPTSSAVFPKAAWTITAQRRRARKS